MTNDNRAGGEPAARIGMVNYLNVAPIYETWKESVNQPEWEIVEDHPSGLNRRLLEGSIDLGFVSSYACGLNPEKYLILPGLSISANGAVGSVFLFSHVPFEQLGGAQILLTAQSATSIALVKVILEKFIKVKPKYTSGNIMELENEHDYQAVLAIGDDALKLVDGSDYLYQFDLGDIWKRETELPFVFAVFAVRREFAEEQPELLHRIHKELVRCCDDGRRALPRICELAGPRVPITQSKCVEYLKGIEYDLSARKRTALETFFSILITQGELPKEALPLQFFCWDQDK
ncbi:menaquinone biosynthesis protein [Desulforhopalus vacuolatus]|uniref:menaquinone biosynthetic enzyme MqnA/MqnD family protein n=1 Tax=Desulforhopalus vacuolatus TaxID=40414 RepID=UPI0019668F46|nr:menaquinone biosynthesis protein [Desulforhopalus vacuolatus]MBM9520673.1 menaquinone biosynthesis protein [Desulforhopalus vacuolatus]